MRKWGVFFRKERRRGEKGKEKGDTKKGEKKKRCFQKGGFSELRE